MPKLISALELDQIVEIVSRFEHGARVADIAAGIGEGPMRRTLQRRLALLVKQKRLNVDQLGRAATYRLATIIGTSHVTLGELTGKAAGETYVPVSLEGAEIKADVRRPLMRRQPVGYNVPFLDAYRPNQTWYLPESLRVQLHAIGRSSAAGQQAGTFARDIFNRLVIDLSWASSRLEGNTYSLLDTERLIEQGQAADGKDFIETQMILNHKVAIEYLVHDARHVRINRQSIIALHALLSDGLLADPAASGKLRSRIVEIGGSVYRPLAMPQRLAELFDIVISMAAEIRDPFEQSFFLMVHLPYLQPFEDVNKRVSRLAANIPLIKHNLCPLSFIDVPERAYVDALLGVYELNRIELLRDVFVWAYERSCHQYVAVRSQMVPPDTFRLRYRAALTETVRAIVRKRLAVTNQSIRQVMPESVLAKERTRFVKLVTDEFDSMHADNAVRFNLRPLEFEAWRKRGGSG